MVAGTIFGVKSLNAARTVAMSKPAHQEASRSVTGP
jgi:hypothetical protein